MTITADHLVPTRRQRLVHGWMIAVVAAAVSFPIGLLVAYGDGGATTTSSDGAQTETAVSPAQQRYRMEQLAPGVWIRVPVNSPAAADTYTGPTIRLEPGAPDGVPLPAERAWPSGTAGYWGVR